MKYPLIILLFISAACSGQSTVQKQDYHISGEIDLQTREVPTDWFISITTLPDTLKKPKGFSIGFTDMSDSSFDHTSYSILFQSEGTLLHYQITDKRGNTIAFKKINDKGWSVILSEKNMQTIANILENTITENRKLRKEIALKDSLMLVILSKMNVGHQQASKQKSGL